MAERARQPFAPEVVLCAGKDCLKRDKYPVLLAELEQVCSVRQSRCLGVCKGPVVVLNPGARRPRAFVRLRKGKQRRDFVAFALGLSEISERLQGRELHGSKLKLVLKRSRRRGAK